MTTLAELTQIIARTVMKTREGTATGGTTTTVADTLMTDALGAYNGGTIWITRSGVTYSRIVTSSVPGTVTFSPSLPSAVVAGDTYTVAPDDVPKNVLEQAIRAPMTRLAVLKVDTSATVVGGGDVTLPTGVSDVRQVLVEGKRCFHWQEIAGKLRFDRVDIDGDLEIRYAAVPSWPASDTTEMDAAIDPEWFHWAAVTKLWRDYIRDNRKDNPVAIELFNEARQNEQLALNGMRTRGVLAPGRDLHHAAW